MSGSPATIEKCIRLSEDQANRLLQLARDTRLTEDQVIAKALDILFTLTDLLDARAERPAWSFLSEDAFRRVWDNDEDAAYDNWRELYGAPAG
jgi:hypothetical protein